MSRREISLVVGTAGHIDHGKTQLVKAMTGIDCDRLNEEKKRGITIELGFAPLVLPSERVISLIDVPGHDRFIRQMVSGASGVDAVLFVVAADEGVMPQTREHLDILSLLGVRHGVIAITKTDLVDEAMLELVREDVQMLTAGTFLEHAPVCAVSSVTGAGVDELKARLDELVDQVRPRERDGAYFMPIDRSFPVAGFGTVVTGTAYKGSLSPGDEVDVLPSGRSSRVRSVQVHGRSVETAFAGQRVAMCLSDLGLDEIERGDVVGVKGVYRSTNCLDVMLKLLDLVSEPLEHWQRVRLHIGTSDVLARVSMLDGRELAPGRTAPVQLVLEEPVAATIGQRFIIRFYSPLRTIGGGEVLVPYARRPSGKRGRVAERDHILRLTSAG
ncbi:MAG: selenocysteine-specific translation elongation factor, partial [Pyramidobacter sp.]|nr:selenocysteine-specific translation elongation factor [Pyramidobacter sp.]